MWMWIVGAVTLIASVSLLILVRHRIHRSHTLSGLAASRSQCVGKYPVDIAFNFETPLTREFAQERLVRIGNFLKPDCLRRLRTEAESNIPRMVNSFIPIHKKGKTLSYESIHRHAHACLGFYHSPELQKLVSQVTGTDIFPTPDQDQSSLSVLCYNETGDHINWHFDHNFYRGRHFTVLLSLANESTSGQVSQSRLMRRTATGDESIDTSPNTLVIFEGAQVLHRASPTAEGDVRIMLSMTYCADPRTNWLKEFARRVKDTAFFGLRALWD